MLTWMDVLRRRRSPALSLEWNRVALPLKRVLGLGVILTLVGAGCDSSRQLGAKELLQQSKSLQSEAAEGALLAEDAVSGKATSIYTREHAFELYGAASEIGASLKAAHTEPAFELELGKLAVLATQISADLKRLSSASTDGQRILTRELHKAAQASQKIGEGFA
jgi:hypothetical protein